MRLLYRLLRRARPAILASALKRLLWVRRRSVVTLCGETFWIDPVSHFGGEILEKGIYEPELTQLLSTLLRPGDTFIDVGGNEGYFSVLAANLVGGQGRVFCIEPQSRLMPVLRENIERNASDPVSVHRLSLSDQEGEMTLHLSLDTNSGSSSFFRHWRFGSRTEQVPSQTLDRFFEEQGIRNARLVKLDCEGAELLILRGAERVLDESRIEFLIVEYHVDITGIEEPVRADQRLRELGYRLTRAGNGIWIYHRPGLEKGLAPLGEVREIRDLVHG